jgi:hypothetical protein
MRSKQIKIKRRVKEDEEERKANGEKITNTNSEVISSDLQVSVVTLTIDKK